MNRLIFPLILACQITVTAPISAEEIKLTTIVPEQTTLRAKKGVIGNTYYTTISDLSIPASTLLVEGNVGIGTTSPTAKLEVSGVMRLAQTARPVTGTAGMIYYGTDNIMYYHNGSTWVDMGGGGGGAFGQWVGPLFWLFDQTVLAATDGIVVATADACTLLNGFTNVYLPPQPVTLIAKSGGVAETRCITFPVRKNSYYKVTASAGYTNPQIWWLTIGN